MLDEIVAATERRLPEVIARWEEFRSTPVRADRPFHAALSGPGISVIAEVKRRSPSRGTLNAELDPAARAAEYERGGASAISVLTERDHFDGSPADLQLVKRAVGLPTLRLVRTSIGPWSLNGLQPGEIRSIATRDAWLQIEARDA